MYGKRDETKAFQNFKPMELDFIGLKTCLNINNKIIFITKKQKINILSISGALLTV